MGEDNNHTSPLLPSDPSDQIILNVPETPSVSDRFHGGENDVRDGDDGGVSSNPFRFLGCEDLSVPPATTTDPFRNDTPKIDGVYEWVKIAICLPIALARVVVFVVSIVIGFSVTKLAIVGWKDKQNPMPKWRFWLMWVTRFCARCILFSFGYVCMYVCWIFGKPFLFYFFELQLSPLIMGRFFELLGQSLILN